MSGENAHKPAEEEHYRKLEHMYLSGPVNAYYAPELQVFKGRAEVVIAVRPEFFHAAAAVHGSVYFKAMDDAAFFAVNSLVKDVFVLTVAFNIYLTRPISEGKMKATGWVVHRSRRLFLAEAHLVDANDREIGRGNGTFMRSTLPLSPKLGYNLNLA